MERIYPVRRERCQDENAGLAYCGSLEEHNPQSSVVSENQSDFQKINSKIPLILDLEKSNSYNNNIAPHSVDSLEVNLDSLCIFDRTASVNMPSDMILLDFIIKNLRYTRGTLSINDVDDFVDWYSPAASSPWRVIIESIEAFIKVRTLTKSPSIFDPGATGRQIRSRSLGTRKTKYFESMISAKIHDTSPQSIYERKKLSCSSTTSICSYNYTSPTKHSISTGLLHCVWKNGLPYSEFFVGDPSEIYVANPLKVKCSVDKALDYIYLLYSGIYARKDFRNYPGNTSRSVGKMKVSTSLVYNSDKTSCMETKFVLFGSNDEYSSEMQSSSSLKRKGLAKKVVDMLKPSHTPKPKSSHKVAKSCSQLDGIREIIENELNAEAPANLLAKDFPTNLELAAITVKDYKLNNLKDVVGGGWGLKFLKRSPLEPSSSSEKCEENCAQTTRKSDQDVHVIVPTGFHGGPVSGTGGPSSLTERWESRGQCDCGGWDIGCPITILNSQIGCSDASAKVEVQDSKTVDLFIEGAGHGEPVLRLCSVSDGVYLIRFQSTLSALQCFSVGVALIHAQATDLYPKL